MKDRKVHIFNPETDYALAGFSEYYTPTAQMVRVRRKFALLPALYASPGDIILLLDNLTPHEIESLEYYSVAKSKDIKILTLEQTAASGDIYADYLPNPWGWNPMIRKELARIFPESHLPSDTQLSQIRALSHRRTSIEMLCELDGILSDEIDLPREIWSVEEGMELYHRHKNLFFKAPWSSSGRGIIFTGDLLDMHVEPWLRGIIRAQGSVIAEKFYPKRLDFATEWRCTNGNAEYLGLSVFEASTRGKYHRNIDASQAELEKIIRDSASNWGKNIIDMQMQALNNVVAPYYDGPLGIDMLVMESGEIHPFIEMNLRHTMGMVKLL